MNLKSIRCALPGRALAGVFLLTLAAGLVAGEPDYQKYPRVLPEKERTALVTKMSVPGYPADYDYDAWSADYEKLLYDGLDGWKAIMTAETDPDPRFEKFRRLQHLWEVGQYPRPLVDSFLAFRTAWILEKTESREWTKAWVKADLNTTDASRRFRRDNRPAFAQDQLSILRQASLGREYIEQEQLPGVRLAYEYYTAILEIELKHHPWSSNEDAATACAEAIAWWRKNGESYVKSWGYGTNYFFSVAGEGTEKHPVDAAVEQLTSGAGTEESTAAFRQGLKLWDEEMNRVYQELRKALPKKSFTALKASQVQWLTSRKSQIAFINSCYDHFGDESQEPMRASAIMEVTRVRTLDLTRRLQVLQEQEGDPDGK